MRIAHVSIGSLPPVFSASGGAIQRWVGELAAEQARRGHSVVVVSPGPSTRSATVNGVHVKYIRCRFNQPWAHIEFQVRALSWLIRSATAPDIIHFHSEPEGGFLSSWSSATRVLSYNNFYFRGGRQRPFYRLYRHLLHRFDLLLPCSEYCRDASADYWRLSPSQLRVSYAGVDVHAFRPDERRRRAERITLGVKGPVILYVGRICKQKGTDTLLEAYEHVRARTQDADLVLVGPIEQFDARDVKAVHKWKDLIENAGAMYIGAVADERLPRLYNAADVFVMPTAELEMFGMAAVEAEACGVPVVASDHGGLRETVPTECGARFPPGDATALADAVMGLLTDDVRRHACAERARAHALQFAWPQVAARLETLYAHRR
jgi:glycosyltransferase involved in cell wall biosynthesis